MLKIYKKRCSRIYVNSQIASDKDKWIVKIENSKDRKQQRQIDSKGRQTKEVERQQRQINKTDRQTVKIDRQIAKIDK